MNKKTSCHTEVEARFELVKQRYGKLLSAQQQDLVKKDIEDIVSDAEAMRAVTLKNSDEPLPLFQPYRDQG